jgi:multidrug efflux pump subunit AcrA (membrane-fusion protein)
MNTDHIENLLQKAPRLRTPAGLLDELQSTVELPRADSSTQRSKLETRNSAWFRRWMPAMGFALWFLGCMVVFGIQNSQLAELRVRQRASDSAQAASAQQALAAETLRAATEIELEQLRKDLADVQRLRAEIGQLRAEMQELATLRAQNQQLREEMKSQTTPAPQPKEDFFAVAQERAGRTRCVNSLKQLGLAARMWANESKSDVMPDGATLEAALPNLRASMPLGEKIFLCPSDRTIRYEILGPGAPERRPEIIYSRCPVHNIFGLSDGSVQQIDPTHVHMVQKDGWWILERR